MAARENQGYLIAVIILVLLALILALAAFLGLSKASENADARSVAEQKQYFTAKEADAQRIKGEILKAMIGDQGPSPAEIETQLQSLERIATDRELDSTQQGLIRQIIDETKKIKDAYDADTAGTTTMVDGDVGKQTTYRERISELIALVAKKGKDYNTQVRQTDEAEKEADAQIAQMQKTLETTQAEMVKLREDLEGEKQRALENENRLKSELADAKANLGTVTKRYEDFQQKAADDSRGLQNQIAATEAQNKLLKNRINRYEREVYDNPDGQVTKVAPALGTVFVNLGSADGLTNNRTFAVYDAEVTNFEEDNFKAKIEITRVDDFRSEARIIQEDPTNPILKGDHILTATWDPGFAVPIALAGIFDLDGDRFDDTEKLARMIERNGGKVVAMHDSEGNIQGEIDSSVRYLVKGNAPVLGENANPNIVDAMQQMEAQAVQNTVQVIDLQKLLNRMGVRAQPKTLQLNLPASGFPTRTPSLNDER